LPLLSDEDTATAVDCDVGNGCEDRSGKHTLLWQHRPLGSHGGGCISTQTAARLGITTFVNRERRMVSV